MKYQIKNAAIELNGSTILNEINLDIIDTSHIGIVGRNGAGKTTLLNALRNKELFTEGVEDSPLEIIEIGNPTIGYLEQVTFKNENNTLLEEIKDSYKEITELEKKLDRLVKKMENEQDTKTIEEYTNALDTFEYLGGYTYQKEYETMLSKFGFSESDKQKPITSFSGGERTKIAFLKLLLSQKDILFLDEPTNHLDITAIEWLENYLKNYKKAYIIVSHDRMFLNNTVNTIIDISYGKTTEYIGNYEKFEQQKKENYEKQLKDYERQQKEIARLNTLYEKFRKKPSKAKMALSKLHMIERMEKIEKPRRANEKTFKMNLNKMTPSGKNVLSCKNLEFGFDKPIAKLDLEILQGEKIGVIGANGTGKSTLLKTIHSLIPTKGGHITFGFNVTIGYFDQTLKMNNEQHTILEEFKSTYDECLENEARSALGAFQFSGLDVNKKINVLSGGEKVRLSLCKILYKKPNFLILDEPTNHLDLEGKEQLENILSSYKGTILFVSHDRYFTNKLATRLLVFENATVTDYHCTYLEYKEKEKNKELVEEKKKNRKKKETCKKTEEKSSKKEMEKLEKEITKWTNKKQIINEELYNKENFKDFGKMKDLQKELEEITKTLTSLEEEWLKRSEFIEQNE